MTVVTRAIGMIIITIYKEPHPTRHTLTQPAPLAPATIAPARRMLTRLATIAPARRMLTRLAPLAPARHMLTRPARHMLTRPARRMVVITHMAHHPVRHMDPNL